MPDSLDLDTLTAAATEAASRGDAVAAASLLRLALDQQVSALGPDHHDLAPTLNNLAMMLERQGETEEAERCYRRAYDVARRGAPPDDPLVKVSRANLVAFLEASGVASPDVDAPPGGGAPAAAAAPSRPRSEPAPPAPAPPPVRTPSPPPPRAPAATAPARASSERPKRSPAQPTPQVAATPGRGWRLGLAIVVGALAGGVLGWLLIGSESPGTTGEQPPSISAAPAEPVSPPAPPDQPAAPPPGAAAPPSTPSTPTKNTPAATAKNTPDVPRATAAKAPPAAPEPTPPAPKGPVPAPFPTPRPRSADDSERGKSDGGSIGVEGRICTALVRSGGAWRCEPAGESTTAGAVYYYSRVRSPRDVTVRHRWSHQGTVTQTVSLDVRANPREGFRTFSRQNLAGRNGTWEVSLLAPDGTVVETQRFTVR